MCRYFQIAFRAIAVGAWLVASAVAVGNEFGMPAASISLDRAEGLAVVANPTLAATEATRRAAEGALLQARVRPNTEALLEAENFGLDLPGWSLTETTLSLAQPLETAGKRGHRVREAEASQEVARLDGSAAGFALRAEVRRRFFAALGLQERLGVLRENLRIAEETLLAVRDLVRAGEVSPIEELRVDADAAIARTDLANGESDLRIARRNLAVLWGGAETDFGNLLGALSLPESVPDLAELLPYVDASPSLGRWKAEEERRAAGLDLQQALARPDVTVAIGVRRFEASRDNAFVASVGIPLPLFDRRKGAIAEAAAQRDRAALERLAESNRLRAEGESALARLNAAIAEASRLQEEVLPKVRQVHDSVQEGYRRGKFRLLDLLDARRTFSAAVLRDNDALVAVGLASADLYFLTGGSWDPGSGGRR
jgi:cobalt-zinc-cadmium efflux system outer membrane protein